MTTEPSFGQLVKTQRRELGLTQDELARRVGCAPVTIRKIEHDDLRPSVQIAERLAMALSLPLEERAAFVRLARAERAPLVEPTPTPMPRPEEIGAEDLTGRAIRGYALGELIGSGGMGAVYRAVQPLVEREVAIKIVLPQYANHPDFVRRFEVEAQLVARLEHPHIVPLYDYWREPGVAYLVMRLLRGGSLRQLLEHGPIPVEMTLRLLEQVGSALGVAHRAGVVHRDLKPANVLLDEDQNAYLADFGIAKNLSNPNLEDQTQVDAIVGSPAYISPEQIRSEFVRPQTDIYCLGVVLYELLTGHAPFYGPTPIEVLHQHLSAPLPPLAARRAGLPGALDAVIERATAKEPMARYPDVEGLLADLRRAVRGELQPVVIKTLTPEAPPLTAADNPYKGLRAFGEGDAADFFGREALTQQLLIRLGEGGDLSRFLAVVGPSGSGKSSVVGAGLVPALRRGGLPGSDQWFIVELMPGAHPLEELEAALLRIAVNPPESLLGQLREDKRGLLRAVRRCLPDDPNVELVLVIDQFEEVFTLVNDEAVRAHLLDSLVTAVLDERSRLRVLITLRADFTDRPLSYVDFGELVRQRTEFVLPLTPDELENAITGPAERVGLTLEPGLVEAIIRDVGEQPGALPLLQYALTELFEKCVGAIHESPLLTKAAYHSIGGVLGALGRRAEEVFGRLDESGQSAARQLFLRLVTLGEGVEDTRRRVLRSEIESISNLQSPISKVIDAFGKSRLLAFDRDPLSRGPTVEVAHEALLREWPRLREWLNEGRADVRLQRQLATAAAEWQSAKRDSSFLLTGARLEQFEGWALNTTVALTADERAYLNAGLAERDRRMIEEQERQRRELEAARKLAETERQRAEEQVHYVARVRTRNRAIAMAGAIAFVLAVLAGLFGLQSNQNAATAQAEAQSRATQQAIAEQQSLIASVRELAGVANLNLGVDPERSILLALQAVALTDKTGQPPLLEAQDALHRAVQTSRLELTLSGHTDIVWYAVFSPDGKLIATGSEDGTAKIWEAVTGKELFTVQASTWRGVNSIAFSPDGKLFATADADKTARVWDVASGSEILTLNGHSDRVQSVAFSPDGTRLATTSNDGTIRLWDALTGKELLVLHEEDGGEEIYWVDFNSDGSKIVTAAVTANEGWASVWDLDSGKKMFAISRSVSLVNSASFSPDDTYIVTATHDQTAKLWDAKTGKPVLTFFGHAEAVTDAAFSSDGTRLATSSWDRHVKIWDVATGRELFDLAGHTRDINTVAFSPDGARVVTTSVDKTVKVWNVASSHEYLTLVNGPKIEFIEGAELAYSPDGSRLVTANSDPTPKVWDVKTGKLLFSLTGHTDLVTFATYNKDGTLIGTASNDGTAKVWDALTGRELLTLTGHKDLVFGFDFSPDGIHIATSSFDFTAQIWDAKTGKSLHTFEYSNWIFSVSFSPDGKHLAGGSGGVAIVWDVNTGKQVFTLTNHNDMVDQVVFSPDGTRIATASLDGTARLWDASNGKELFGLLSHSASVFDIAFSGDSKYVATTSSDKTAKIWDVQTGKELLTLIAPSGLTGVAFSPDGSQLAVAGRDGTTRIYLLHIEDLIALAKSRLTRSLTEQECQQYLHVEACP